MPAPAHAPSHAAQWPGLLAAATLHIRLPRDEFYRCLVRTLDVTRYGTVTGHTELAGTPTAFEVAFDDRTSQLVWPSLLIPLPRPAPPSQGGARPTLTVHAGGLAAPAAPGAAVEAVAPVAPSPLTPAGLPPCA